MKIEDFEIGEVYNIVEKTDRNRFPDHWRIIGECIRIEIYNVKDKNDEVTFKVLMSNVGDFWKIGEEYWIMDFELEDKEVEARKL